MNDNKDIKVVAIIPARGGSKGIPFKNLQKIGGIPLVGRTIIQAIKAPSVNKVIVSTENEESSKVAKSYGADVIKRPEDLAGDSVSSEAVLIDSLQELKNHGYFPDLILLLQCTSPFMLTIDIEAAINILKEKNADVVFSVFHWHGFLWRETGQGGVEPVNHDANFRKMRQELETTYQENGAVYVMKSSGFINAKHRFFGKVLPYIMPTERSLDIDDPCDLELAEFLLQRVKRYGLE